jgi:hypothetical protein
MGPFFAAPAFGSICRQPPACEGAPYAVGAWREPLRRRRPPRKAPPVSHFLPRKLNKTGPAVARTVVLTPEQQVMLPDPRAILDGTMSWEASRVRRGLLADARARLRRYPLFRTPHAATFVRTAHRHLRHERGAAGGDPVMGARQFSGSLADLWPETTAIILLAMQHEGSKTTTLAQGTLWRNGLARESSG